MNKSVFLGDSSGSTFFEKVDLLPTEFDVKQVELKRQKKEVCDLCQDQFNAILNSMKYCNVCAKAVCQACSETLRQLSRNDTKKYRVCDECECNMENYKMKQNQQEVIEAQSQKIVSLNDAIERLDNTQQEQHDEQK